MLHHSYTCIIFVCFLKTTRKEIVASIIKLESIKHFRDKVIIYDIYIDGICVTSFQF